MTKVNICCVEEIKYHLSCLWREVVQLPALAAHPMQRAHSSGLRGFWELPLDNVLNFENFSVVITNNCSIQNATLREWLVHRVSHADENCR